MSNRYKKLSDEHLAIAAAVRAFALETSAPDLAHELHTLVERYTAKAIAAERNADLTAFHGDGGAIP